MTDQDILSIKQAFGPVHWLDFRHLSLVDAHHALGVEVKSQAAKNLAGRLDGLEPGRLDSLVNLLLNQADWIRSGFLTLDPSPELAAGVFLYSDCLRAWAAGARLADFEHPLLLDFQLPGDEKALLLALFLQNESIGCQTGFLRSAQDEIIGWHTEEDRSQPGERFDRLRIAIFHDDLAGEPVDIYSFIYPDLLPGPAFAWRSDRFVQMVDTLYVKDHTPGGIFANCATWLNLFCQNQRGLPETIECIGPFADGYAVNTAQAGSTSPQAKKIEFTADQYREEQLGKEPGSYLIQVNIFSDSDSPICVQYEEIAPERHALFRERLRYTSESILTELIPSTHKIDSLFNLLCSRNSEVKIYSYAGEYVKAYFYWQLDPEKLTVWVGSGPAQPGDQPEKFVLSNRNE